MHIQSTYLHLYNLIITWYRPRLSRLKTSCHWRQWWLRFQKYLSTKDRFSIFTPTEPHRLTHIGQKHNDQTLYLCHWADDLRGSTWTDRTSGSVPESFDVDAVCSLADFPCFIDGDGSSSLEGGWGSLAAAGGLVPPVFCLVVFLYILLKYINNNKILKFYVSPRK